MPADGEKAGTIDRRRADDVADDLAARGVSHGALRSARSEDRRTRDFRGDSGPRAIAWFKDPAGHVLSVLQTE
jgi:hypothetical protein